MIIHGVNYPQELIDALKNNEVVIFAGAGVSKYSPSCCPLFSELAQRIASDTGMSAKEGKGIDHFLGRLSDRGINIRKETAGHLNTTEFNDVHTALLSMFTNQNEIKIITTNLDLLFEECAKAKKIIIRRIFSAPAMPVGKNFRGLAHLHGDITYYEYGVLDDKAFGEAYITEGWASRFLLDICKNYITWFIGYSHEDTIMRYFSRAVPQRSSRNRYIMTSDSKEDWEHIGIKPIFFEKNNWEQQRKSLIELARILHYDYFNWENAAKGILQELPSNTPEDIDRIKYILANETRIKIFTDNANKIEWLNWLEQNKYLEFLFVPEQKPDIIQTSLCNWIVEKFLISNSCEIMTILGNKLPSLHPQMLDAVCCYLHCNEAEVPEDIFRLWLTVLLGAQTFPPHRRVILFELVKRPLGKNAGGIAIAGFLNTHYNINRSLLREALSTRDLCLSIDDIYDIYFEHNDILEICSCDYQSIIYHCVKSIHQWYMMRECISGQAPFDAESFKVSAIEEHEQNDEYRGTHYAKLLRDILLKLQKSNYEEFLAWINILVTDKANLLKRLAIYLMAHSDESADSKIDWLIENVKLHDSYCHHEVYVFLTESYPKASPEKQQSALEQIKQQAIKFYENREVEDREESINRIVFKIVSYLQQYVTNDDKISTILAPLQEKYPIWKIDKYVDFSHACYTPDLHGECPWIREELYELSPKDFITKVTSYTPSDCLDQSEDRIEDQIQGMAKDNINWAITILKEAILENSDASKRIVTILCYALKEASVTPKEAQALANVLCDIPNDNTENIKTIIRIYSGYIENNDIRSEVTTWEKIRNNIDILWDALPERNIDSPLLSEWITEAINDPSGMIVEFYLQDLSKDQKSGLLSINSIPKRYIDFFTKVCKDESYSGRIGQIALSRQFSWLLYWIPDWVKEHFCPLFLKQDNEGIWEGVLSNRRYQHVFEMLFEAFNKRIVEAWRFKNESIQKNFIKYYSAMLIFYVNIEDFSQKYLPALFDYMSDAEKPLFSDMVRSILKNNEGKDREELWETKIKPFLKLRIENKPRVLTLAETSTFFEWAEYLDFAFPDYVTLLEQIPRLDIPRHDIIYNLNENNELCKNFDVDSLGRLLLIMLTNYDKNKPWVLYGINKLFPKISSSLSPALNQRICALAREKQINIE